MGGEDPTADELARDDDLVRIDCFDLFTRFDDLDLAELVDGERRQVCGLTNDGEQRVQEMPV
jgi:hypothetical protein